MKHLAKVLLAAGALVISTLSHGAPVDDWAVTTTGIWFSYAPNSGISLSGDQKTLSWGNGGTSSLVITDPSANQSISTYWGGVPPQAAPYLAQSVSLTHNNQVLNANSTVLTGATLRVSMTLTPTNPVGSQYGPSTIDYAIKFVETTNATPCAANSPTPCNDIFVLTGGLLNESFSYDGYTYFVNAFPTQNNVLSQLTPAECTAAGAQPGCIGFTTPENKSTTLPFGLSISSNKLTTVPEPGSLALLGLALAGAGLARRRRRA